MLPLFLGSIIYNKRREMNLTQIELANDICTQNTISKIEKHNIAPTVNILIKICLKLDLTLNDVFSDFSSNSSAKQDSILDAIEQDILLQRNIDVQDRLSLLEGKLNNNDMKQYELINGMLAYKNHNFDASLFTLDKVLQYTKSSKDDVYTFLAYLFKGLDYVAQKHYDRAQYYFEMIDNSIDEDSRISNASDLEILFICKTLAKAYNDMKSYQRSYEFSQCGLNFAQRKHVSYFLDDLNYQLSVAIKNDQDRTEDYNDYYNLALYLAKFNQNDLLLAEMKK
ncbi:helix-turn-helix domain-containing protein [Companilactobacillus sp. FL22-1]|uniref:helix-turn-helix domain-containing protein n=1 Tax=Companilactobacillus sp. FL22-1 TaxID=3373892 RepID=UPI003754427B